jgi:hypothetical protein
MKFESVRSEPVSDLAGETFGQVNDPDCVEGTLLYTHTTADAECLRNEANCGSWIDFNAEFANFVWWTCLCALLVTLFRLAFVGIDDCNTNFLVGSLLFIYHKFS